MRRALQLGLGLAVAAGLLGLLLWQAELDEVWRVLRGARGELLLPAVLLLVVHYLLKGLRWRVLLGPEVPALLAVRVTLVGFLLNNLLPARAGELGRPWLLSRNHEGVGFAYALATLVGDKLFDLLFTLLCLLLAAAALPLPEFVRGGAALLAAAGLIGLLAAVLAARWSEGGPRPGRVGEVLRQLAAGLGTVSSSRRFLVAVGWTALLFTLTALAMTLSMRAVGIAGTPAHAIFVLGLLGVGFAVPSPPTHAGTYHFFAAQAVQLAGVADAEQALAFALVAHGLQVLTVSTLGLLATVGIDWRPGIR